MAGRVAAERSPERAVALPSAFVDVGIGGRRQCDLRSGGCRCAGDLIARRRLDWPPRRGLPRLLSRRGHAGAGQLPVARRNGHRILRYSARSLCAAPPSVRPGPRKAELGRPVARVVPILTSRKRKRRACPSLTLPARWTVPRIGEGIMSTISMPRFRLVELNGGDPALEFATDVAAGLTAKPKHLSC